MNTSRPRSHPRLRRRRFTSIATFVATLTLTLGGVAAAATSYVHLLQAANVVAPQPTYAANMATGAFRPAGCMFPSASEIPGQ